MFSRLKNIKNYVLLLENSILINRKQGTLLKLGQILSLLKNNLIHADLVNGAFVNLVLHNFNNDPYQYAFIHLSRESFSSSSSLLEDTDVSRTGNFSLYITGYRAGGIYMYSIGHIFFNHLSHRHFLNRKFLVYYSEIETGSPR